MKSIEWETRRIFLGAFFLSEDGQKKPARKTRAKARLSFSGNAARRRKTLLPYNYAGCL
jgi:hypothetical protein